MFAVKAKTYGVLYLLMKHLALIYIGQHVVTTGVVHLPKRTKTSLITEADLIIDSDQDVRAVHSCNSRFLGNLEVIYGYLRVRLLVATP